MGSRFKLLPQSHTYDEMYLTINGVYQGLISKGASSVESLGSHYKRGHGNEDRITILGFSYGGSNPTHKGSGRPLGQGHSNAFGITKRVDKSSPLLHNAMGKEALPRVKLTCYRTSYSGRPEHYFTVTLKNARVVVVDTFMENGQEEPMEHVYFSYHELSIIHERCGTVSRSNWQHSPSTLTKRLQMLEANDFNGYNALHSSLVRRGAWIKEHPEYFADDPQKRAIFWTVVTLPLSGVALYKGSYGAIMWTYRNPIATTDFITGFGNPVFLNPFNPYHRAGFIARKTLEAITR